ncbi:DUF262 domain-containing protein [Salmonella enterica subsp. enterica serovar Ouagadougou]|uniref:DUF262 domain-containing protein n=1 Tax=Salmonella enterica subsp. enterica serovar Ouagadougou TaxID=2564899 RepID=A0A5I0D5J4_SALET|nr:DUF262 domain-containing protein [Salmonella enterica subsp. enterica serovar Ouagadougou]EBR9514345.1 DUF262 domain-containing protein [Salmonella enterica subsp. enterica serovar Ouagadougou]EBV0637948.1 DUF262 domain-containing protein [Salmonella enterica subsp. enterica serovar Ouagadougou]EBV0756601.1 DUF262 domain-containing protein [Salmonella enterica subsp. enterica serovar Ouagadougou]EBV0947624.1 DUF262 domain-containing protein [Salmonella enterica subsp. enterica serovar Ouagad
MSNIDSDSIKQELSETGTLTGIEADLDEEMVLEPFDPDAISIEQKVVPMDTLIRRLKQQSIHLSPNFQRNEVWDVTRRSRLIESLLLKIPLPMFYVASDEKGTWEVVDGLQRLSTIRDFIIGNENGVCLTLKNLEFLGEKLNGKTFRSIENDSTQQRLVNDILETEMRFTVINPGTPEAVKRNIFKRINTGGMPLTLQEIRHALYQGKSSTLLYELSCSEEFLNVLGNKVNDTRMASRELILRFISFLIFNRESYKSNLDSWLSNAMRVINLMPNITSKELNKIYKTADELPIIKLSDLDEIKDLFKKAMLRCDLIFDGHAFRKSIPGDERKTPINKSLFEVWSNVLCHLTDDDFIKLKDNKKYLLEKYKLILEDADFVSAISRHSSMQSSVIGRYNAIENIVKETIDG